MLEGIVTRYRDDLNEMYADTGSDVRVEILDYERNFSSSVIDWRIDLGSLAAIYGINEIIIEDRARHGITGVVSTTSLEKNPWFVDLVQGRLDGKNPLTITTSFSLSGTIESIIDIAAFSFELDNQTVDIRPGRIVTKLDQGVDHLVSKTDWGGLNWPDAIQIDDFQLAYDLEKISTYTWAGDLTYSFGNIRMQNQENEVAFEDFSGDYNLDFNKTSNLLSATGGVGIASLQAKDETVTDMLVTLEMNNLDANGYEEFMSAYTRTVYALLNEIREAGNDPARMQQIMQQQMTVAGLQFAAAYEKLLKKGLVMQITELRARIPQGKISGNAQIQLNRDLTFAQLSPVIMQPRLALDIFSFETNLRFPAALAGDNPPLVTPLYPGMQTGFFVREGSNLVHSARTENGKLLLNGTEVVFNQSF